MKILTGEIPENHYHCGNLYIEPSTVNAFDQGQLSTLNRCVEVDLLKFPEWIIAMRPEGELDSETMFHLKDIPIIIEQFIQFEIKKQEKIPTRQSIKLPLEERRRILSEQANDPEIIKWYDSYVE